MAEKKYVSEFALYMRLRKIMLLQQNELKRVEEFECFNDEHPCHIYLICKRQRILIDPDKFFVDDDKIIFAFKIQHQDSFETIEVVVPNNYGTTNVKLTSEYPYNSFELYKDDKLFLFGRSALLLHEFGKNFTNHLDLEILYIGQSYGVDGSRTAPERLNSHSTLQGIYAEAILKNPDCEIWIVLTSFDQDLISRFDGTIKVNEEENEKDMAHLSKVYRTVFTEGLKEQQIINFTEAALIRYFNPQYNVEYKNTFPNPAHTTYSECYDLDINTICIELDSESIHCRLFSKAIEPKWNHFKDFFLHSVEERKAIFDFNKSQGIM